MKKLIAPLFLMLIGTAIMVAMIFIQGKPSPPSGEYYYSKLLRINFNWVTIIIFSTTAFVTGYLFTLNSFIVGLFLIGIFPITSIIESIVYPGSHNLIPFEFVVFFAYGLPATVSAFAGKWLFEKSYKRKLP